MSKLIHDPALARIDDNGPHSSTFVIEPLHASYGNTLGNSLRRVLLSSIRGGAFTAFRMQCRASKKMSLTSCLTSKVST